jgi:CRISPR/Cas system CMR-associated protein Cmr1 (group 7 of RAMP superfamily)
METMTKEEIYLVISNLLFRVIADNKPYTWYRTEEPFFNIYNGRTSYDYSGEVREMLQEDLIKIEKETGDSEKAHFCYTSELDELLSEVYINQWLASYQSNCGKYWVNYKSLLEEAFNEWKYANFPLYDEETDEEDEDLETKLDSVLYEFIKNTSSAIYYAKILQGIKK